MEMEEKEINKVENKVESLDDLKFGDILVLRNREKYVVADGEMYGEDCNYDYDAYTIENEYNDDLSFNGDERDDREYDIVKVIRNGKIVFNRKAKKMTIAEVCEELGYDVEIIEKEGK